MVRFNETHAGCGATCEWRDVHDYPNDFNAIHEALKSLTHKQKVRMVNELWAVVNPGNTWDEAPSNPCFFNYLNATAAQRAEAFLRTIGKWVE